MTRGKFITFEGVDGAGKSTHVNAAANYLRQQGRNVVVTREPGGTPLGEQLRTMILSHSMHIETETLLVFAARREHIARLIEPALSEGQWVISDRFTDATYAYQGGGRGLPKSRIAILEKWVHEELQPDLTLFFDLPVNVAQARLAGNAQELDRFEREGRDFFERVREAYLDRAAAEPGRIHLVDASQSPQAVWTNVEAHFKRMGE